MQHLLSLGQVVALDELSRELKRRISAHGLGPPRSFEKWAEQILVDHPDFKALVVNGSQSIPGNLEIDNEELFAAGIATIAILGDLTVTGRLINADSDNGPFLFVDGDLSAAQIEKGGASFVVLGSVRSPGLVFCDYNLGAFLVGGNLEARAIVSCDQEIHVGGTTSGLIISEELGNMRANLVPEVFADPDDPDDEFADASLVRERLEAGLPVLKV